MYKCKLSFTSDAGITYMAGNKITNQQFYNDLSGEERNNFQETEDNDEDFLYPSSPWEAGHVKESKVITDVLNSIPDIESE